MTRWCQGHTRTGILPQLHLAASRTGKAISRKELALSKGHVSLAVRQCDWGLLLPVGRGLTTKAPSDESVTAECPPEASAVTVMYNESGLGED